MKKIFLTILVSAILSCTAFAETNIAVVDFQKVFQSSPQVSAAREKMQKQFLPQQEEILAQQKKLKSLLASFNKNNAVMKDKARKKASQDIIQVRQTLISMIKDYRQKVAETRNNLMNSIIQHIQDIIADIAKKNNFDLVLLRSSVPYASDKLDITDQVIKQIK
ncbi:MAG: OmpH family outer membrane protein [Gammaproteobacteria bacterium]|nr:OmpH family outer membrane protein [Gammaproteobacteria bacterium]